MAKNNIMETIRFSDMISNTGVIAILEEIGFREMSGNDEVGYQIKTEYRRQDIEVYLKRGYLNIHLTPAYLNLEIYKQEGPTFYYNGTVNHYRSWYRVKKMQIKKTEEGISEFRNFLLLSICRESFLTPEEDLYRRIREYDVSKDKGWSNYWYR